MFSFVKPTRGCIKVKAKCPVCGLTVLGIVPLDKGEQDIYCQCGRAVLSILLRESFEWLLEDGPSGGGRRDHRKAKGALARGKARIGVG